VVVRNEDKGLVILRQENPGITGFAVRLGAEVDLVAGCSGHVLLAFGREGLPQGLAPERRAKLEKAIAQVREQGYERLPSARTRGVIDISCPIFGFGGHAVAAFTIPFLEVMDGSQLVTIDGALEQLKVAARRASQALGWVGEVSNGRDAEAAG
jgi:DNA-binding IclR family transcriptional regulator